MYTAGNISSTEMKRVEMERKIRGEGKVAVQVSLADDAGLSGSGSKCGARWVIRKRIPVPATIIESTNGTPNNDTPAQQQQNWRWLASSSSTAGPCPGSLIGEVIKIEPSNDAIGAGTLATITVRRMWLPEHTLSGRLAHHGAMELFDDVETAGGGEADDAVLFKVPIEHLVIVGRHVDRAQIMEQNGNEHFQIVRSYSAMDNRFTNVSQNADEAEGQPSAICHRCRIAFDSALTLQCSSEACRRQSTIWCKKCIDQVQRSLSLGNGAFEADGQGWIGPCCTGRCDCDSCRSYSSKSNSETTLSNDICSVCAKPCADGPVSCKKCSRTSHQECAAWERALRHTAEEGALPSDILCTLGKAVAATKINSRACRHKKKQKKSEKMNHDCFQSGADPFKNLSRLIASANPSNFDIPASFGTASKNELSFEPFVGAPKRKLPKSTPLSMPMKIKLGMKRRMVHVLQKKRNERNRQEIRENGHRHHQYRRPTLSNQQIWRDRKRRCSNRRAAALYSMTLPRRI